MNVPNPWWKERADKGTSRIRWLGLFRRSVRLRARRAGQLTPSPVTLSAPHSVALTSSTLQPTAQHLSGEAISGEAISGEAISGEAISGEAISGEAILAVAHNLSVNLIPSANAENGSINLIGVSLHTEPSHRLPPPQRPDIALRTFADVRPPFPANDQVPLWKRLVYLLQPPTELLLAHSGPLEWPGTLFPYQLEGIQALISHDALLLADDMGLGKTIQTIAALRLLVLQRQAESVLLIVRAGLLTQWRKELHRWAPELRVSTVRGPVAERTWQWTSPAHVYLVSYETFRTDFTDNPHSPPRRRVWDVVVLDEAQTIKNREAEISLKCKRLLRRRAWALTGTPLENSVEDLASLLEFVNPLSEGETPRRYALGPALRERQMQVQLRRKKADVLPQLPPKIVSRVALKLEGAQRESYVRAEREGLAQLRKKGDDVRLENILELIVKLKQICNFCPRTGQSAKLNDMRTRLQTLAAEEHRALIFSQFADERYGARAIAAALSPLRPLVYTGDLATAQKEATIRAFKTNPTYKALVLSLRAGGEGLNLQEASYVFHFDRWWNPAIGQQAESRSHRFGQMLPAHIYSYICEDTVEERIERVLQQKQMLFDEMVEDISIDLPAQLSIEELFGVFELTPPTPTKSSRRGADGPVNYAELSGIEFERYVQRLLVRKGWSVETTPVTRDRGIDLIARRDDDVGGEVVLYIQCKNHAAPVGVDVARELNGALPKQLSGARGVLVCPSGFTASAITFARERGLALWDRHQLFTLAQTEG